MRLIQKYQSVSRINELIQSNNSLYSLVKNRVFYFFDISIVLLSIVKKYLSD